MYSTISHSQFQQSNPHKQQFTSSQLLQYIKKKPYTQVIHGVSYTYSILCKKRQTFLFGNDRFLYLKGIESISYAREFPNNQKLPFTHQAEIPTPKATMPLNQIQNFINDQERLIIQFSGEKRVKWQFVCPSKVCALEWRKKLDEVTQILSEFSLSGFHKYQDFLRNKEMIAQEKFSRQQSQLNNILASRVNYYSNEPFSTEAQGSQRDNLNSTQNSQYQNSTPNQSNLQPQPQNNNNMLVVQQTKPPQVESNAEQNGSFLSNLPKMQDSLANVIQSNRMNIQDYVPIEHQQTPQEQGSQFYTPSKKLTPNNSQRLRGPQEEPNRPTGNDKQSNLYRGPSITKIDSVIYDSLSQLKPLNMSMSNISNTEKQTIRNDIAKLRKNWVEQILNGSGDISLVISFKTYIQRIAQVIVNELYVSQDQRIFPFCDLSKEHAAYEVDDVVVELYYFSQEHLINKNPKYKNAVLQFKNYDYLLGVTQNQGVLKVPPMVLFQYKGFLGMGKLKFDSNSQYCNKQAYDSINRKQFQEDTRVSADVLLNQSKCKIVSHSRSGLSLGYSQGNKVFFFEKLTEFLPYEKNVDTMILRPEFLQDDSFDYSFFKEKSTLNNRVSEVIDQKIDYLVNLIESEKEYITNSRQLTELIHISGLNMRHIGLIYKKVKQNWLKNIIKADIIARTMKNYFRFDLQNLTQKVVENDMKKQRQQEREANRVISFLNVIFGNTEATFRIWRNLNSYAQETFQVKIWQNQFSDIHVPYLLLAIQCHLKIVLSHQIHQRKVFKSMQSFQPKHFIRFEFDTTIYNLDYTDIFEEIHQCLQEKTFDSFHNLCEILTKQINHSTYFQLLRNHPINEQIKEFLLEFTSPQDNHELYSRIQDQHLPSRLMYQSKLAEIRWNFKSGKHENNNTIIAFLQQHVKRWFGDVHPALTHLNRLLAEYYSLLELHYAKALKYAMISLDMQQAIFGGDCQPIWKDYFLIGKIHYLNNHPLQSLKYLVNAKQLVKTQRLTEFQVYGELCLMLAKCYFGQKYFKQSYTTIKELYLLIRQERDEQSLALIIQAVTMIKQLLEINQQHESYERFIQSDFSQIVSAFADYPALMNASIKMIAVPNLKHVLLRNSKNRMKLLGMIDQISKITQSSSSCLAYLKAKLTQGGFPKNYLLCLKDIDAVIGEIEEHQMIERWVSFNKMANQSILDKISGSINRGFQFLAVLTALFNLLGPEVLSELFIMEK